MVFRSGLFLLAVVALLGAGPAGAAKDHFDVGDDVPVFTLKAVNPDVAGAPYVSIDHFFGAEAKTPKKAILLSFFATYCEPCKKELPYLASLQDAYSASGLQTMLVSIDKEADKVSRTVFVRQDHFKGRSGRGERNRSVAWHVSLSRVVP